jgi:hypothetical protein
MSDALAQPNTDGSLALAFDLRSNGALQTGVQVDVCQMFSVEMVADVPDVITVGSGGPGTPAAPGAPAG